MHPGLKGTFVVWFISKYIYLHIRVIIIEPPLASRRLVSRTLCLTAYGHKVTTKEDDIVSLMDNVDEVCKIVGAPGSTPVDMFPMRRSSVRLKLNA